MLKINLKSKVSPKVFWPSIIILLIISTFFFILKEKEKTLRIYTQKQLHKTNEEKEIIENKLVGTAKIKEAVERKLVVEKEKTLVLEKEIKEKEQQISLTLEKLEKEIAARRQAEGQLMIVMKEKQFLEAKVKKFGQRPKTIELEKIVVKPASTLVGKILIINKEHSFVVVDVGSVDNLRLGAVLSVYRNGEFIGKVQVERMEERMSAAAILPEWQDIEFKENDMVEKI